MLYNDMILHTKIRSLTRLFGLHSSLLCWRIDIQYHRVDNQNSQDVPFGSFWSPWGPLLGGYSTKLSGMSAPLAGDAVSKEVHWMNSTWIQRGYFHELLCFCHDSKVLGTGTSRNSIASMSPCLPLLPFLPQVRNNPKDMGSARAWHFSDHTWVL